VIDRRSSLLREVAGKLKGKKAVIVVDGLDEVDNVGPGENPLGLPISLPAGVYLFATMRKETRKLQVGQATTFRIDHDSALNTGDIRTYMQQIVRKPEIRAYIAYNAWVTTPL
jgi:hypothetical protein